MIRVLILKFSYCIICPLRPRLDPALVDNDRKQRKKTTRTEMDNRKHSIEFKRITVA